MTARQKRVKGAPTHTNLFCLRETFTRDGVLLSEVSSKVPQTDYPHLKRCLAAGLIVAAETHGNIKLTDAGRAALEGSK